jgi:hypothetical protein
MPNQNDPTKPPSQGVGGTNPKPATGGSDKSGTQKDGGGTREQPNGGANRPPQQRLAIGSPNELFGPLFGSAPHRRAYGC